jgi:ABC-type transport system substrate-binding protein
LGWYYSNARIDELLPVIQQELDDDQRQAMLDEVHMILKGDVANVSVHVQPWYGQRIPLSSFANGPTTSSSYAGSGRTEQAGLESKRN